MKLSEIAQKLSEIVQVSAHACSFSLETYSWVVSSWRQCHSLAQKLYTN